MLGLACLKLLEARSLGERRLVALLQLVVAGLLAAQRPELGPTLLQGTATVTALAGLLALELDAGLNARALLSRSLQVALAALPMALLLLVLVPRLDPLVPLPAPEDRVAETGLSADLDPGGIARLAGNDAPAARLAFAAGGPPAPAERYWRVLVHERFDGRRWQRGERSLEANTIPLPPAAGPANQLWLMEPSRFAAVPWDGTSRAPAGGDESLRLHGSGELLLRQAAAERRTYRLAGQERGSAGNNCRPGRWIWPFQRAASRAWRPWGEAGRSCPAPRRGWRRPRAGSAAGRSATASAPEPCLKRPVWMRSCSSGRRASAGTTPVPTRP